MKSFLASGFILALLFVSAPVFAHDHGTVTISGEMMCAKCTLKVEGAKQCQDVVVTKAEDGTKTHYYVVKNDVAAEAGHTCTGKKSVTVTGSVAEKDGQHWITASSIVVN